MHADVGNDNHLLNVLSFNRPVDSAVTVNQNRNFFKGLAMPISDLTVDFIMEINAYVRNFCTI